MIISIFKRVYIFLLSGIIITAISGCAAKQPTPSGFLGDYSSLQQSQADKTLYLDENPYQNIGEFSKLKIDPVLIHLKPDAKGSAINPDELKELADLFTQELQTALGEHYTIVDTSEDGVLRLRTAITDVVASNILLNLDPSSALTLAPGVGGASMEAEFVDAHSGVRVLAIMNYRKGERLKYKKSLSRWGHTKDVLKRWAEMLSDRVVELTKQ